MSHRDIPYIYLWFVGCRRVLTFPGNQCDSAFLHYADFFTQVRPASQGILRTRKIGMPQRGIPIFYVLSKFVRTVPDPKRKSFLQ
jgi:hypothetical protein